VSHEEEGGGHDERWVISYADLVTLLFGFFIIMYASAEVDQVRFEQISVAFSEAFNVEVGEGQGTGDGTTVFEAGTGFMPNSSLESMLEDDAIRIRAQVDQAAYEAGITPGQVEVIRSGESVVLRLSDSLLFTSASAEVRREALPLLDVVAEVLRSLPNEVRIEGHTDNVPVGTAAYPTNWELSSARATSVLRYLVESAGVEPSRMVAAGYAEFEPIATNVTPEGRALNRRADVVLVYTAPLDEAGTAPAAPAFEGIEPIATQAVIGDGVPQ
jgi:chemotaxis protein MotB